MARDRSSVPVFWIQKDGVLGALAVQNAALTSEVNEEIAAFH
jgi:hypothetical protein